MTSETAWSFTEFFAWLPPVLGALAILVIGYVVAKAVSGLVWQALHRAGFDDSACGARR